MTNTPAPSKRVPFRVRALEARYDKSPMSIWRLRQQPDFPKTFLIGGHRYVWLHELEAYEEARAADSAA